MNLDRGIYRFIVLEYIPSDYIYIYLGTEGVVAKKT